VSAYYHDAAAALVVDGQVIAAMQEERFTRIKNDASLPFHAAEACLSVAGLNADDLDEVVFYENPYSKLERVLISNLRTFPMSWKQFPLALGAQLGTKLWVLDQLAEGLGVPRAKVGFRSHHESHAASAFLPSPFEEAAVLTVDGVGEHDTTVMWRGQGSELTALGSLEYPHSLGLLYAGLTAYCGFMVNEGEYKVMGLSSFGQPRFREQFDKLIRLSADGSFELGLEYFAYMTDPALGFGPKLEQLLGPRRPVGRPWDLDSAEDRRFADVAATLQQVTEEALLGLCAELRRQTDASALCLAGGVALNAVANARLLRDSGFDRIWVQPAAGDAGAALGAAMLGSVALGDGRTQLDTMALGTAIDAGRGQAVARSLGLVAERVDQPANVAAELLGRERIVAVANGRFEFGPRALGQRSLLANPAGAQTRDHLNRLVKHREPFRPFAPAVLADRTPAWFDGEENDMTPYMTTVLDVRADKRDELRAVTHVDGTARLQTVRQPASMMRGVLESLERRTGSPVVLNTSLNGPGEPICATETDALGFFVAHRVDALLLDDVLVTRP